MSKSVYSSIQIPAIPFTAAAMKFFEMLEQMILAGEGSFSNLPVRASYEFVREEMLLIWIRKTTKRTLRPGLRNPPYC
jgi:hypothetical protein